MKRAPTWTNVMITPEVHRKLSHLKVELGMRSFDQVLRHLLAKK